MWMQLKYCVSFMNSRNVSKSPDRLPRSISQAFGGEDTFTNSMCLPPMISSRSGLRGVIVKVSGARATISITKSSSIRTFVPLTMQPARRRCSTASGFRNSIPMSRRMRIAVLCTRCTASASRGSIGASGFTGMRQGIWSITAVPARTFIPARPPARFLRAGSSVMISLRYLAPKMTEATMKWSLLLRRILVVFRALCRNVRLRGRKASPG